MFCGDAKNRAAWCWVLCVVSTLQTVLPSPQRATKLAHASTEILYIEDGYPEHRSYTLEDFFWTGSGDGAPDNPWDETDKISTVYKTKTIMSTIYISVSDNNQTETSTPSSECIFDCDTISTPEGEIRPTPTVDDHTVTSADGGATGSSGNATADRHFWILTVIKTDGKEPMVAVLEKRLAKLYSVAFRRQQERHLGINKAKRSKRDVHNNNKFPSENKPVNVFIHTLAPKNEDTDEVEVLYHVLVSGKPVAAVTAASDMRYVTDEEVATELGFPITTKAEPYLKMERPQSLARTRDTWLFIGVALATIFLLLLMVSIFTLCLNKKKRTNLPVRPAGISNRQHVFDRETRSIGTDNSGFVNERDEHSRTYRSGKRYHRSRLRNTTSNETLTSKVVAENRPSSSSTTISSTSSTSSDASPLMLPLKHKPPPTKKKPRQIEKRPSAINKSLLLLEKSVVLTADSVSDSDKHGSETTLAKDSESRGKISPKSYLSMPSVKSFPKSCIPETLNKVLEPVSVLHLDMAEDFPDTCPIYNRPLSGKRFIRHGSMGCEDPGVIGPVVWELHAKRLQNDTDDENRGENHTNRMRRRFNELLDDTFSLFGTTKEPETAAVTRTSTNPSKKLENRGKSAVVRPTSDTSSGAKPRPKTSDPRRVAPSPGVEPPKGAWSSATPSPLVRPLSAPYPKHHSNFPVIEMERIVADGALTASDPAVPLIAAIRTELEKCSLPGSTTNLAES